MDRSNNLSSSNSYSSDLIKQTFQGTECEKLITYREIPVQAADAPLIQLRWIDKGRARKSSFIIVPF